MSVKELLEALQELLMLSEPKRKYIVDNLPRTNSCFLGRETELCELHDLLKCNKVVCVRGIGGIGKTELVKNYALQYKDEFGHVIFATYLDNIQRMFLDEYNWMIYNYQSTVAENILDAFNEKFNLFRDLVNQSSKDILIILDDLSDFQEDTLFQLLSLDCKFIITSRTDAAKYDIKTMELGTISEEEALITVFENYYGKVTNIERQTVNDIIEEVDKHTLVVELIAKQMKASRIEPKDMLNKIKNQGVMNTYQEEVVLLKNNRVNKGSASEHVQNLFKLAELQRNEVICLENLSLIPSTGIEINVFKKWSDLENFDIINGLIEKGWMSYQAKEDIIFMHPVIASVINNILKEELSDIDVFLSNMIEIINSDEQEIETDVKDIIKYARYIGRRLLEYADLSDQVADFLLETLSILDDVGESGLTHQVSLLLLKHYSAKGDMVKQAYIYACLGEESVWKNPREALDYFSKALDACDSCDNYENMLDIILGMGDSLLCNQEPKEALKLFRKIEPYCADSALEELYLRMGNCYRAMANEANTKKYYLKSLTLMKKNNRDDEQLLRGITKIYSNVCAFDKAPSEDKEIVQNVINHNIQLLESESKHTSSDLLEIYGTLYQLYALNKDTLSLAEEYGLKAISQYECIDVDIRDNSSLMILKMDIAERVYEKQGRLEEAKELLLQEAGEIENGYEWIQFNFYNRLCHICCELRLGKEAKMYGKKARKSLNINERLTLLKGMSNPYLWFALFKTFVQGVKDGISGEMAKNEKELQADHKEK